MIIFRFCRFICFSGGISKIYSIKFLLATFFTFCITSPQLKLFYYILPGLSWPAEFKLTGLEPATVYKAQVSGVNENGAGPFTQFIFGTQGTSFNPESGKLVSSSPARFGVSFILCIVSLLLFIS